MVYYAKPMHLQSAFEETDSSIADCPITERLCKTVLSLPIRSIYDEGTMLYWFLSYLRIIWLKVFDRDKETKKNGI